MDRKRCPHVSGDPNQRTHVLPCRDVFCFSCLKEIPGLLDGRIFSCPLCGGYSQYVDPSRAILGDNAVNQRDEPEANIDCKGTTSHSMKETDSHTSTTQAKAYEKGGYNTGQRFGSDIPTNVADGFHASERDHGQGSSVDDVTVNPYETERQRKLLERFNAGKKHSDDWVESSEDYVRQSTGSCSDCHSEWYKNPILKRDLHREQVGESPTSNNPREENPESGSSREDSASRMEGRTAGSESIYAHPSDYSSLPAAVVGVISADEFHQQGELMNQIKQKHETKNTIECDSTGRVQVLYDNIPHQDQAVGVAADENSSMYDHGKNRRVFCESHNSRPFAMYCPTCNTMLCKECLQTDPTKHKYHQKTPVPVKTAQQNLVSLFERYRRNLDSVRKTLDTEYTRMEKDTAEIFRKAEEMKRKIDTETENACKKLKQNAEEMTTQVDEKVKQLFDSRESHIAKVNEVQKKLDNATEIVRKASYAIDANNIPLAVGAEESVLNFIGGLKDMKLQPPKDSFDLEFHSTEIPGSSSASAPIRVASSRWRYHSVVPGPVYFYLGGVF